MSQLIISSEKLVEQVKLTCQYPSIVEGIAARQIIKTVATQQNIEIEPEELQQAADNFRLANRLYQPKDTWSWLKKHGLSLEEFESLIYYQLLGTKLAESLFASQIEPFFMAHQLDFTKAAIYEVFLDDQDLAMELFYAIQEQEISFSEVAHQYIQDNELRRLGGYRGLLSRGQLKPEISAAVFAATPPQILKPIITASGVHLIWVEEIIPAQLTDDLRQEILKQLFTGWMKQQIAQLKILQSTNSSAPPTTSNPEKQHQIR